VASEQDTADSAKQKRGQLQVQPGMPLRFLEEPASAGGEVANKEEQERARQVGATLKAYRKAVKALLSGQYAELREYVPTYLKEPCDILAICCTNGLILRYDLGKEGEVKIRSAVKNSSLTQLAPIFSDYLIHFPPNPESYDPGPYVPKIELEKVNFASGKSVPIATIHPLILAPLAFPEGVSLPPPPQRPPCLVSVTNELQIVMEGVAVPADPDSAGNVDRTHDFVARGTLKLAVGWQAIEIYPPVDAQYWKPEYAPLWAERDLLAAVARRKFEDAQFAAIDPNVAARNKFRNLIEQLQSLLDGPEEPAHQFLKSHPELLSPIHMACWSKLRLGERVTDFVFREPANEYLLVELESPLRELFRKDGQQREELTHAFNQILDWRTYIEDNLRTVQDDLGLTKISSNPNSLIVIGRSLSLTEENRRKLVTLQNQIPKLRILTYDDLIQSTKALAENLFGPLDITGENIELYFAPNKRGAT